MKKELKISLSTVLLFITIIIIAIMSVYIYNLKSVENPKTEEKNATTKTISGEFTQGTPENPGTWYDSGTYIFKDDGTVEHVTSGTSSGVYTINGNIISIHFTEGEDGPINTTTECLIKDDNTLLFLNYETEDHICYVKGTAFFRQDYN